MAAWFEVLRFETNPLDVRPNPNLVGLSEEEGQLRNHIQKGEICFLNGLTGTGKSSMLMKMKQEMSEHKFIYLDANDLPGDFNLVDILKGQRSWFDKLRLMNFPSKKPVLIIDEFQATDPNLVLEARAKWENPTDKKIHSIVISQISRYLKNVSPSFRERLGSRIVALRTLDEDEMKEILRRRLQNPKTKINYAEKMSDDALTFVVRCSGGNPRRLLEYADEIFDFHHTRFGEHNPVLHQDYMITYHGVKEILSLGNVHVAGFEHLSDRKEVILRHVSNTKITALEKRYNKIERRILRFLRNKPRTVEEISQRFMIASSTTSKHMANLKAKKGVLYAGRDSDNRKLWQISPEIKRLMVKV